MWCLFTVDADAGLASFLILHLYEPMSLHYPDLKRTTVARSFLVGSFSELLIGGRGNHQPYHSFPDYLSSLLTASVLIAWNVAFVSSANIIGFSVLRCLVNSVSFLRLLDVSLVVMELTVFSGSRHMAKYWADGIPFISTVQLLRAGDRYWTFCDSKWRSSTPRSVYIACQGLDDIVLPWYSSLLHSRYACWMTEMCLRSLLIYLCIWPVVVVSPRWVFSGGSWLDMCPAWATWLMTLGWNQQRVVLQVCQYPL